MQDQVQVVRYIRPHEFWDSGDYFREDYAYYSNLYGITVVYDLNYSEGTVCARYSICNGDNFSKEEGVRRALDSKNTVKFNLDIVNEVGSLNSALISTISQKFNMYDPVYFEEYLDLFLKNSRNL